MKEIKTYEEALQALQNGYYIYHIPHEFVTQEFCIEFIKLWEYGFQDIPKKYQTEKLRLLHENLWVL